MIKELLANTARIGTALTLTTTAGILAASANENEGAWGAINNVSHIVDGDDRTYSDDFSPRDSTIGLAINGVAMFVWAAIYYYVFGRVTFPKSIAAASVFTAGAYVVDYHLVPKQYTPGIEHKISKRSIFWIYVLIFLTLLAAPGLVTKRR